MIAKEIMKETANQQGGDNQADEFDVPYFSEEEREQLRRWRAICAQRPPMTRGQIESVGALLRALEQRRAPDRAATRTGTTE